LAGVHVCCDMLSNRNDFWQLFLQESNANDAYRWTSWTEQVTEIGAELALVGALVLIWRRNCDQCKVAAGTSRGPSSEALAISLGKNRPAPPTS
jgi:hypothetical protein